MGVRERKRETKTEKSKKKEKTVVEETPIIIPEDPLIREIEPRMRVATSTITPAPTTQDVVIATPSKIPMPEWGGPDESEWMYQIPSRREDIEMWAEEWGDYLLQWAEATGTHVISVGAFIGEEPFKHMLGKTEAFKIIASTLIDKEIAEWTDKKKKQLRIYWRPLEDWVDIIYDWAISTGNVRIDVKSIIIQESHRTFATLPEKDLYKVMAMMVDRGLAKWVDKKKGAIVLTI